MTATEEIYKLIQKANEEQTKKLSDVNEKQTKLLKEELKNIISEIHGKVNSVITDLNILKEKNVALERKVRRNNIVIFGLDPTRETLLQDTIVKLNNLLQIDIIDRDINHIYTVGKKPKPPVIVEFSSFLKKQSLFRQVKKLKGTGVVITNDLCYEDREERRVLRYHQQQARSQNLETKIKGNKLIIGTNTYTVDELNQMEKDRNTPTESDLEGSGAEEAEEPPERLEGELLHEVNYLSEVQKGSKPSNKGKGKKLKHVLPNAGHTVGNVTTRGQKKDCSNLHK